MHHDAFVIVFMCFRALRVIANTVGRAGACFVACMCARALSGARKEQKAQRADHEAPGADHPTREGGSKYPPAPTPNRGAAKLMISSHHPAVRSLSEKSGVKCLAEGERHWCANLSPA